MLRMNAGSSRNRRQKSAFYITLCQAKRMHYLSCLKLRSLNGKLPFIVQGDPIDETQSSQVERETKT